MTIAKTAPKYAGFVTPFCFDREIFFPKISLLHGSRIHRCVPLLDAHRHPFSLKIRLLQDRRANQFLRWFLRLLSYMCLDGLCTNEFKCWLFLNRRLSVSKEVYRAARRLYNREFSEPRKIRFLQIAYKEIRKHV